MLKKYFIPYLEFPPGGVFSSRVTAGVPCFPRNLCVSFGIATLVPNPSPSQSSPRWECAKNKKRLVPIGGLSKWITVAAKQRKSCDDIFVDDLARTRNHASSVAQMGMTGGFASSLLVTATALLSFRTLQLYTF